MVEARAAVLLVSTAPLRRPWRVAYGDGCNGCAERRPRFLLVLLVLGGAVGGALSTSSSSPTSTIPGALRPRWSLAGTPPVGTSSSSSAEMEKGAKGAKGASGLSSALGMNTSIRGDEGGVSTMLPSAPAAVLPSAPAAVLKVTAVILSIRGIPTGSSIHDFGCGGRPLKVAVLAMLLATALGAVPAGAVRSPPAALGTVQAVAPAPGLSVVRRAPVVMPMALPE